MEARGGIEPPIKVLQTLALPLGYRAVGRLTVIKTLNGHYKPLRQWALATAPDSAERDSFTIGAPTKLPHSVHEPS